MAKVASRRFHGISFRAYSNDHSPRHVHAVFRGVEVIIELREDGSVALADRRRASSRNAKASDIKQAMRTAAQHFEALVKLWEEVHGTA